jgi:hypothetical protein
MGDDPMRYFLELLRGFLAIVQQGHEDEFYVGYVYPNKGDVGGYSVREGGNNEFAVAQSLEDAIAAIAVFYKENRSPESATPHSPIGGKGTCRLASFCRERHFALQK